MSILLATMPPVVHIRREADQAALRCSVERMLEELREPSRAAHSSLDTSLTGCDARC